MTNTTTRMTTTSVGLFRRRLNNWALEHGRHHLEWRLTRDPYAVLVSEVMLQQTQVERVRPYYRAWMAAWPSAEALAGAPIADVIRAWAGLGYNRRAVNLQRAASQALHQFGCLPADRDRLQVLPGVGPYTAAAVACFAGGAHLPVLDTNVSRVIARHRAGAAVAREAPPGAVPAAAAELLPRTGAREHNLALMDLGAMVCTARAPSCETCPLRPDCKWRLAGRPALAERRAPARPFPATARYARGRIVDFLRAAEQPLSEPEIAAALPQAHAHRAGLYLRALARDGLAAQSESGWTLPVTAG